MKAGAYGGAIAIVSYAAARMAEAYLHQRITPVKMLNAASCPLRQQVRQK